MPNAFGWRVPAFTDQVIPPTHLDNLASDISDTMTAQNAAAALYRSCRVVAHLAGHPIPNAVNTPIAAYDQGPIYNVGSDLTYAGAGIINATNPGLYAWFAQNGWPGPSGGYKRASQLLVNGALQQLQGGDDTRLINVAQTSGNQSGGYFILTAADIAAGGNLQQQIFQNSGGSAAVDTFMFGVIRIA